MSIYDEIGGRAGVAVAVDTFNDHVMADHELAPYFAGTDMARQKRHLRTFLAAAVGGAERYAGRDMGAAHAGLHITDDAFDRVVGHLVSTLTALGVAPATIGAIGGTLPPLTRIVGVCGHRVSRMQSQGGGPGDVPDVRTRRARQSGRMPDAIIVQARPLVRHPDRARRVVEPQPAPPRRVAERRFAAPIVRELPPRRELRAALATW